nr:hypothetical protein BaRGS_035051 [Batillaria attramentaria]
MTLRSSFMSASLFNKLSFIFSIIAVLCAWISFVMPAWGYTADPDKETYGAWYGATQALTTLGFVGVNLAFLLIILQIFVDKCKGVAEIAFWNFIQCILTSVCYLIAIIVFAASFDDSFDGGRISDEELGYSWGLALVALAFNGIAVTILQFMEGKGAPKS